MLIFVVFNTPLWLIYSSKFSDMDAKSVDLQKLLHIFSLNFHVEKMKKKCSILKSIMRDCSKKVTFFITSEYSSYSNPKSCYEPFSFCKNLKKIIIHA